MPSNLQPSQPSKTSVKSPGNFRQLENPHCYGADSSAPVLVMSQPNSQIQLANPRPQPINLAQPNKSSVPHTTIRKTTTQISPHQAPAKLNPNPQQRHWRVNWFRSAGLLSLIAMLLSSCNSLGSWLSNHPEPPIKLQLHQQWHLQPGQTIAGYPISSSLGDIVINLGGKAIYMPKAGLVQPLASSQEDNDSEDCIALSSPEIPAYRLRLCHLQQQRLGYRAEGDVIGRGEQVAIAMLRKQPEGTWAFVEPSPSLLEALLSQP